MSKRIYGTAVNICMKVVAENSVFSMFVTMSVGDGTNFIVYNLDNYTF